MEPGEIRTLGTQLLNQARAIRAAFPDVEAMRDLPVSALPPVQPGGGDDEQYRAALGHLRDEMLLVRSGAATDLTVLDDEIACVERLRAGA